MAEGDGPQPATEVVATQAALEEVAARIEAVHTDVDERLKTVDETLAEHGSAFSDIAAELEKVLKGIKGSGDASYVQMLEDKIAVLEHAVENAVGIDLGAIRERVLGHRGDPTGATESSGTGEEPSQGGAGPQQPAGDATEGVSQGS